MTAPTCHHSAQKALAQIEHEFKDNPLYATTSRHKSDLRKKVLMWLRAAAAVPTYVLPDDGLILGQDVNPFEVLTKLTDGNPGVYPNTASDHHHRVPV